MEVTLKERTIGAYTLNLVLVQNYRQPPKTLAIAGVHPLGTEKLSGYITVATDLGIAAKTASFEGLTEIPFASVPGERAVSGGSALAYKFIAAAPGTGPSWKLSVTTEAVEPWLRAEIMNTITLTETLVSGRTLVKYDIANAPVKEFRVRVPAAFKNVEVTGAQIRRRDETNGEWRVELQSKVRGEYLLTVTWELPRAAQSNLVELAGIQALGVEREAGYVAIIARPPLQVSDQSGGGLLSKIDVRELPPWTGRADTATVLAYRYLRPGYKLALDARRYDEAEVLQALIDNARLTTVVADDGQVMTEISLSIRNNGRQHLEIELPEKTTVWSAFVAGRAGPPQRARGQAAVAAGTRHRLRRAGHGRVDVRRAGQVPEAERDGVAGLAEIRPADEERALGPLPAAGLRLQPVRGLDGPHQRRDAAGGAGLFPLRIQRAAAGAGGAEQVWRCATGWSRRAKTWRAATCGRRSAATAAPSSRAPRCRPIKPKAANSRNWSRTFGARKAAT